MKQVLRNQLLQSHSMNILTFLKVSNFEFTSAPKIEITRSSHMCWSNVYHFHNCVPVWLIKIMTELLDMELSLDESHTCMLFVELKIAYQTAFGELTEP